MRLDKYLKLSGLIVRRTIAKEACDAGRVRLNGKPAKAAAEVAVNDTIAFDLGRGKIAVVVLEIPEHGVSRQQREQLYRLAEQRPDADGSGPAGIPSEGSP